MKNIIVTIFLAAVFSLAKAQDAKTIVQQADEKMRGNTSRAIILIKTIRATWSREMEVQTWF